VSASEGEVRKEEKVGRILDPNNDQVVSFHLNCHTYPIHFGSNDLDAMTDNNGNPRLLCLIVIFTVKRPG
jgi:hypothetical protein